MSMLKRAFIATVVTAVGMAAVGCDRVQLLAPTNSSVTVNAAALVLPFGGSTEVTAMVLESAGTPVQNGTTVRFTATLGRVDPVEVQTRNGLATTTFFAGDASGIADVRASSGAAGAGGSSSGSNGGSGSNGSTATTTVTSSSVVQISIGAAGVDSVTIQANPAVVSATGGTVDVVATVLGANNRVLTGVPVTFTTTAGTLNPTTATTDAAGQAHTRLTTNTKATVKASVGGKTSGEAIVDVLAAPAVSLTCTVGTATNCLTSVAGQPVVLKAVRATGTSVIRSAKLEFGDGDSVDLGTLATETSIPHVYRQPGDYNPRLIATDVNGETVTASAFVHVLDVLTARVSAEVVAPLTVRATAEITGGSVISYEWTFTDGTTTETLTTSTNQATHTYLAGSLTVPKPIVVKATMADGRVVTAQSFVHRAAGDAIEGGMPPLVNRSDERGFMMAALLVGMSVMAVFMAVLVPVWNTAARREKESELVFRGEQYARAMALFQRKYANARPPNLDVLISERFLRKKYKDPITNDDFELLAAGVAPPQPGLGQGPGAGPSSAAGRAGTQPQGAQTPGAARGGAQGAAPPSTAALQAAQAGAGQGGPGLVGVVSKSKEQSLRLYKGQQKYSDWVFMPVQLTQQAGGVGAARPAGVVAMRPVSPTAPAACRMDEAAAPGGEGLKAQGRNPLGSRRSASLETDVASGSRSANPVTGAGSGSPDHSQARAAVRAVVRSGKDQPRSSTTASCTARRSPVIASPSATGYTRFVNNTT
jgi:type II secretory pathway pseudopilin PulG